MKFKTAWAFLGLLLFTSPSYASNDGHGIVSNVMGSIAGKPAPESAPENTLISPFKEKEVKAVNEHHKALMDMYLSSGKTVESDAKSEGDLGKAHRSAEQIAEWVVDAASNILTFSAEDIKDKTQARPLYLDAYGLRDFESFLDSADIEDIVKDNNLRMVAMVEGEPRLLSEGIVGKTYHWLYQIPVMLTYYDAGSKNTKSQIASAQTQNLVFQVQVARFKNATPTDMGLRIDRWALQR